jgi:hypothetical protein
MEMFWDLTAIPVATKIHPLKKRAGMVTEWITQ